MAAESCGNPAVADEGSAPTIMPKKSKFDRSAMCVKCKTQRGNIVVRHAVYCRDCFIALVPARVRKALDPHVNHTSPTDGGSARRRAEALRPAGALMLGVSGGLGSSVLLDVVHRTYIARGQHCDGTEVGHNNEGERGEESGGGPSAKKKGAKGGTAHPRRERVWTRVYAAHVDISAAFPDMRDKTDDVRAAVARYADVEFVSVRLEDAFDPRWWARVSGSAALPPDVFADLSTDDIRITPPLNDIPTSALTPTPADALRDFLVRLPTPTAVTSAVSKLVRVLLLHTAHAAGASHLLLGTSLTALSISLIATVAQGGGFSVPQAMFEEWAPPTGLKEEEAAAAEQGAWRGEVRVVRPLRDIGMKECAAWAWWHHLAIVGKERVPGTAPTIDGLTKNFIVGLEKDYPSTVSTISKTVAKLAHKGAVARRCVLCELPVQQDVHLWKARISIHARSPPPPQDAASPLAPLLCYSCHTTLTSRGSRSGARGNASASPPVVRLPVWSAAAVAVAQADLKEANVGDEGGGDGEERVGEDEVWRERKLGQDEMRTAVGEFLLDD